MIKLIRIEMWYIWSILWQYSSCCIILIHITVTPDGLGVTTAVLWLDNLVYHYVNMRVAKQWSTLSRDDKYHGLLASWKSLRSASLRSTSLIMISKTQRTSGKQHRVQWQITEWKRLEDVY